MKPLITLALVTLLSACVVVPRTQVVFDECRMQRRSMVLDVHQVGYFSGCANEACLALLVGMGAVAAATAVVSGSIAVAGNVVYWWEERGTRCVR